MLARYGLVSLIPFLFLFFSTKHSSYVYIFICIFLISAFHSCFCHHLIATYLNYYDCIKVLSCKLEHLIYVEDDDDDEEDDDDAVDEEEDDEEGFGRRRKGDVARAARLLGISLPQLGTILLLFPLPQLGTKTHPIVPIISTLYPL